MDTSAWTTVTPGEAQLSSQERSTDMIDGWLSLRVRNPEEVGAWYEKLRLQVSAGRPEAGTVVVGARE